jgi:hypothetical protein
MGHDDGDYDDDDYDYDDDPEPKKGPNVLLIVLLVVVAVFLLGGGLCGALMVPALSKAKARANQVKCANNLRQVGLAGIQFADDTRSYPYADGDWEATTALLRSKGYLDVQLECPESMGGTSYEGFKAPYSSNIRSTTLIAWDAVPHLSRGQQMRNVLFADCSVQLVNDAEFQKLLTEHDAFVERVLAAHEEQKAEQKTGSAR